MSHVWLLKSLKGNWNQDTLKKKKKKLPHCLYIKMLHSGYMAACFWHAHIFAFSNEKERHQKWLQEGFIWKQTIVCDIQPSLSHTNPSLTLTLTSVLNMSALNKLCEWISQKMAQLDKKWNKWKINGHAHTQIKNLSVNAGLLHHTYLPEWAWCFFFLSL